MTSLDIEKVYGRVCKEGLWKDLRMIYGLNDTLFNVAKVYIVVEKNV